MIKQWLKRFQTYRILKNHGLPDHLWFQVTRRLPLLASLNRFDRVRLRILSTLLIHNKSFYGANGFIVTEEMKVVIAAQACLQILKLGIHAFEGWQEIIIYPGAFRVSREIRDENGLVHSHANILSGEAWRQGPVVFSWEDVERDSFTLRQGHNVVIHEFAHKLDMLNGRANGMPPLHPDMPLAEWTTSLSSAYQQLIEKLEHHRNEINAYAATNPGEFLPSFANTILLHRIF